jgi:hypothetical protein
MRRMVVAGRRRMENGRPSWRGVGVMMWRDEQGMALVSHQPFGGWGRWGGGGVAHRCAIR